MQIRTIKLYIKNNGSEQTQNVFFFLHWLKHLNFSNFFFDKGSQNQSSVIKVHHIQHVITQPRAWTEHSSVFILYYHTLPHDP